MSRFPAARFMLSVADPRQFPPDTGGEVAFAGRSNAGKSSAINAIFGRRALARTSKAPGQTKHLNYFELDSGARIIDLPGYGYARAPDAERSKWLPLLEALRVRESLRGLFLIVDARRGVGENDEQLIAWAPAQSHVHVLLSKADKLTSNEARHALAAARTVLRGRATVQLFSSADGTGMTEAQKALRAVFAPSGKLPPGSVARENERRK